MFVRSHESIVWQSLVGNYNVTKTAGYTALIIPTKTWSGRNTTGCSNSKCGKSRRSSCGCRTLGTFILHVSSRLAMIVMIMILLVGWYQTSKCLADNKTKRGVNFQQVLLMTLHWVRMSVLCKVESSKKGIPNGYLSSADDNIF